MLLVCEYGYTIDLYPSNMSLQVIITRAAAFMKHADGMLLEVLRDPKGGQLPAMDGPPFKEGAGVGHHTSLSEPAPAAPRPTSLKESNSTAREGSVGKMRCMAVSRRFSPCRNLRVASSFMMWAAFMVCPIFSRALRSWMPMLVTPMGQGALPAQFHASSRDFMFYVVPTSTVETKSPVGISAQSLLLSRSSCLHAWMCIALERRGL